MKTIGITGGVGAGKSLVLDYIESRYRAKIYKADEIANFLKEPGQSCYRPVVDLLGEGILLEDGRISKEKMAELVFSDAGLLQAVNALIHPAVKEFILHEIKKTEEEGIYDFFILEAALLIEEHYDEILDELWYIHTEREIRKKRLKQTRQYSDEKIGNIMEKQLSDSVFRKHCRVIIENNDKPEDTYDQIDEKLGEYISAEGK